MKRILSLTLVFALMMSFCCISYADGGWTEETEKHYEVLSALKIVNLRDKGIYTGEQGETDVFRNLSKTAFINYVCNITRDYGFTDVYSEDAIKIAEDAGIIHKNQTDLNKPLYYDEAITMLVRLLGYGYHAEKAGGYPVGYITIASRLGLTDGLSARSGERMQEFDAITLLYNAINAAYVNVISFNDTDVIYGNASDTTFLYEFRKIYRVDGVLEGTATSAVTTAHTVSDDYVMIDGYRYQTTEDYYDYLGMNVEAYVRDNKNGNPVVLCAIPNRNEELIIPAEDITKLSDDITHLEYADTNGRERNVALSPIVDIVYNGQPVDIYTTDDFLKADGEIRLIDNNSDHIFDVAFIMNYRTVVVDSVSALNKTVRDFYTGESIDFKEETDEIVQIIGEDGAVAVADLMPGDVLRVLISKVGSKKMIIAYLSRTKITGTVNTIFQKDKTIVNIDDKNYLLSQIYAKEINKTTPRVTKIQPGSSYVFSLDSDGRIAYVKETDGSIQYGLVMATASDGVFTVDCKIKLFTTEGIWKELPIAKKIVFNDATGTQRRGIKPETVLAQIPTVKLSGGGVIGYTTNAGGEINRIDVPIVYDETEESYEKLNYKDFSASELTYRSGNSSFDSKIFLSDAPTVWCVPEDEDKNDEKAYSVSTRSMFRDKDGYAGFAYNLDEFGIADLIVIESSDNQTRLAIEQDDLLVVEDMIESVDSEGNPVKMISGMRGTYDTVSFYCDEDMEIVDKDGNAITEALVRGDIISMSADSTGYVKKAARYSSVAERETEINPDIMHGAAVIVQGEVDDIDTAKGMMKLRFENGEFKTIRIGSVNVIIYNLERNRLSRGTINDIEEGNMVMTKVVYSKANTVVVFQ